MKKKGSIVKFSSNNLIIINQFQGGKEKKKKLNQGINYENYSNSSLEEL